MEDDTSDYFENLAYSENLLTSRDEKVKIEVRLCHSQDKKFYSLMITYTSPAKLPASCYGENWGFTVDLRQSHCDFKNEVNKIFDFLSEKHEKLVKKYGVEYFTLFDPRLAENYDNKILEKVRLKFIENDKKYPITERDF